jgi:hypothetical protein
MTRTASPRAVASFRSSAHRRAARGWPEVAWQWKSNPKDCVCSTCAQIAEMAALRRRGAINDADWARWEYELVAAGREGRIRGALNNDGVPVS